MGELIALLGAYFAFILIMIVFAIVVQWKIYTKAGKPGWACIIPIYNIIVLLEIIKKPIWWIVLLLIPIVNIVIMIIIMIQLAKAFGKSTAFGVGLIFFGIIFMAILAFGDAKYVYGDNAASGDLLDN